MDKREVIGIGSSIEEAQNDACKKLNLSKDNINFEIIQQPQKKKFGIFGGSIAKVKATENLSSILVAKQYLSDILKYFNIENLTLNVEQNDDNGAIFNISGENLGSLIGHRGEVLDSLQYLTNLVANHNQNSYFKVMINIGDYRKKREDSLIALAKKISYRVLKTHRNFSLEPMNPYERKIVHTQVQKINGVKSWSENEGYNRHIIIGIDNSNSSSDNISKNANAYKTISRNKDLPTDVPFQKKSASPKKDDSSDSFLYDKIN